MLLQCDHVNIPGLKVYAFESPPSSSYVVRLKTRGVPKTGAQAVMALLLETSALKTVLIVYLAWFFLSRWGRQRNALDVGKA